jgi:hypothetical protein
MLAEGKEHARQIIAEARQVRCSAAATPTPGSPGGDADSMLIKSFDQLLELAETLLSEQERYESRLHRSRRVDPNPSLPTMHPQ